MKPCRVCTKPAKCDCICSTCMDARESENARIAEYRYNVRMAQTHDPKCDCDVCRALGYLKYVTYPQS